MQMEKSGRKGMSGARIFSVPFFKIANPFFLRGLRSFGGSGAPGSNQSIPERQS
jgi:hypothetical protein